MCDEPDLDIDTLQNKHESPTEWNLRRKFLVAHKDSLPLASLLCMSSCFINIELTGATYPPAVMERVRSLAEAVRDDVESHRKQVKSRTEVKFVKASDTSEPGTSKTGAGTSASSGPSNQYARGNKRAGFGSRESGSSAPNVASGVSFVKSNDTYSTTDHSPTTAKRPRQEEPPVDPKFLLFQKQVNEHLVKKGSTDAVSVLNMASNKAPMTVNIPFSSRIDGQFIAKVFLDFVLIAEEVAPNKKKAKHLAAEAAVYALTKNHLRIIALDGDEFKIEGYDDPLELDEAPPSPQENVPQQQFRQQQRSPAADTRRQQQFHSQPAAGHGLNFALHEHESSNNASNTLQATGIHCNIPVEYEYSGQAGNASGVTCSVRVGNVYSGRGTGQNEKDAKMAACEAAVRDLRKRFYTIQVKKRAYDKDTSIGIKQEARLNEALPDSNVGNKLMKMMGWSGGGIGKQGQGIAEPVSLDGVINREGLGLASATGITPEFKQKVNHMLEDYVRHGDNKDMVFSKDLTNDERKFIHQAGKKLRLKTRSYSKDKDRYLVVSKKVQWQDTFQMLLENGGEDEKHRLIAPGEHEHLKTTD